MKPSQFVPPSTVRNVNTSLAPDAEVRIGATPFDHLTVAGQVTERAVVACIVFTENTNACSVAGGFENDTVRFEAPI
jgi:predicted transcriptional regulator